VHGLRAAFTLLSLSVNLLFVGGNSSVTLKWKKDFLPEICTSSVEVYDPELNTWTDGPDLANALCGAGGSEL